MAWLDWHTRRINGVTLVELLVESEADERIRVESHLEPIWAPRRYGVAEAGWDDTGYSGIIRRNDRLVLGFATPAEPTDPPAEIVSAKPLGEVTDPSHSTDPMIPTEPTTSVGSTAEPLGRDLSIPAPDDIEAQARFLVRTLGTAGPSRDVVPVPALEPPANDGRTLGPSEGCSRATSLETDGLIMERRDEVDARSRTSDSADPCGENGDTDASIDQSREKVEEGHPGRGETGTDSVGIEIAEATVEEQAAPTRSFDGMAIESALDSIEQRLAQGERLAAVRDVDQAQDEIEALGGIEQVRELRELLEHDRQALEVTIGRQERLRERLERIDIPLATLQRLA